MSCSCRFILCFAWLAWLLPLPGFAAPETSDPKDEEQFRQLDVSEDGFLSGREAKDFLKYDADGDKKVSLAEFLAGRAREREAAKPVDGEKTFRELDKNQDGVLSGKERRTYAQFDKNEDGVITREEFLAGLAGSSKPTSPPVKPSETPPETPPPPSESRTPEAAALQTYQNQKEKLSGPHASHFVPFRFSFPPGWKLEPTAGTESSPNTVRVERKLDLGKDGSITQENFTVGFFASPPKSELVKSLIKLQCEQMQQQVKKSFAKAKVNPLGEMKIGTYKGQGFDASFRIPHPTKKEVKAWVRYIVISGEEIKQPHGLVVIMIGTEEAPELTSLADLGVKGGLAAISKSFVVEESAKSNVEPPPAPPVP